jgi:TorA maturation chaperone TorD
MAFGLLSTLWLHEPDAPALDRARELLYLPTAYSAPELAQAYAELFLLNVYPYGTVFSQPSAELNGPGAEHAARFYAAHNYAPPELHAVGAPDHLGLGLGLLGHLAQRGPAQAFDQACAWLLAWAPVICLAVEREPGAHPFYRALAAFTAEALLNQADRLAAAGTTLTASAVGPDLGDTELELPLAPTNHATDEEEVRLRDVLAFFLAPARCGVFLSRGRLGRLGRDLGLSLPFAAREVVAEALFSAAGQAEQVAALLGALSTEVAAWAEAYAGWRAAHSGWAPFSAVWLSHTHAAQDRLTLMLAQE